MYVIWNPWFINHIVFRMVCRGHIAVCTAQTSCRNDCSEDSIITIGILTEFGDLDSYFRSRLDLDFQFWRHESPNSACKQDWRVWKCHTTIWKDHYIEDPQPYLRYSQLPRGQFKPDFKTEMIFYGWKILPWQCHYARILFSTFDHILHYELFRRMNLLLHNGLYNI